MIKEIMGVLLALSISAEAIASKRKTIDEDETETRVSKTVKTKKKVKKEEGIVSIADESSFMYSDERPQDKCIFTLDLSNKEWEDEEEDSDLRKYQVYDTVKSILKKEGFVPTDSCTSVKPGKIISIFGRFISKKLKTSIIVATEYTSKSLSTTFEDVEFMIDSRAKRSIKQKWNIRLTKDESTKYNSISCTDFSWNWVDSAIHCINVDIYGYGSKYITDRAESNFIKQLYRNIRRKGLENTLIRISVVANSNSLYSFNIIYNNENEETQGRDFLLNLKKELQSKFIFV